MGQQHTHTFHPVSQRFARDSDKKRTNLSSPLFEPRPFRSERSPRGDPSVVQPSVGENRVSSARTGFNFGQVSVQCRQVGMGPRVTQLQDQGGVRENRTGMPDGLKAGIEQLSGFDLSGVRVHYNSAKPKQLNAHAYAQGQHIHLGPGQDRHLPHEAWHVVQQMQGRVRPTMEFNGAAINDSTALEREADRMGARAVRG